jgi:Transposase DDE domain group 1
MWLRSGNTSSNNLLSFLEDTLSRLKNKTIGLIRLDSDFCSNEIFKCLQQRHIDYIVAAKFYQPVQQIISEQQSWIVIENGIEISEMKYQAANWKHLKRMDVVRQKIKDRLNTIQKNLSSSDDESIYKQYLYTAYFTTLKLSSTEVWRLYRSRADAENRIKELKYDFGFSSFNLNGAFMLQKRP